MLLLLVFIFCIASVHCAPSANSSQIFDMSDRGASSQSELPSKGDKEAPPFVKSCHEAEECGVYTTLIAGVLREVYCEVIGNLRFIVVQRRGDFGDPVDYFYKGWLDYKLGFGDPRRQFWLGNDALHNLTEEPQELYIDMEDFEGLKTTVIGQNVSVSDEDDGYLITFTKASPMPMGQSFWLHNLENFSTKDKDNSDNDCANKKMGGWWYFGKYCGFSNLNGLYLKGHNASRNDGVYYKKFRGDYYSLKSSVMKIRVK